MHLGVILCWPGEIPLIRNPRFIRRLAEHFFPISPEHGRIRWRTPRLTLCLRLLESRQDLPCQPPRESMEFRDVDVNHVSYVYTFCLLPRLHQAGIDSKVYKFAKVPFAFSSEPLSSAMRMRRSGDGSGGKGVDDW